MNPSDSPPPPADADRPRPDDPPPVTSEQMHEEVARLEREAPTPALAPPPPVRPDLSPHTLVLLWCCWLLASWFVTVGLNTSLPSIRWLLLACLLGLAALWPALRLSQDSARAGGERPLGAARPLPLSPRLVFTDWVCLMLVFQVVVWPLRLTAGWTVEQTAWLDAAVGAWTLLVAAIVAWGVRSGTGAGRTLAMAVCLLILLGEPLLQGLINLPAWRGESVAHVSWPLRVSPLRAVWHISGPRSSWRVEQWQPQVLAVAAAAVVAWVAVAALWRWAGRDDGREP